MIPEIVKAVVGLVLLAGDICLVLACSSVHFIRGALMGGTLQGAVTLGLFFLAGLISNLYHFFGHEWQRMQERSTGAKAKCYLLLIVPCYSLVRWYIARCTDPESLSRRCWTASLRLFYCTGAFMQALMQSYVAVQLWWDREEHNLHGEVSLTIVAAVLFSLHAVHGVCGYIWTTYYEETHTRIPILDFALILVSLTFNMGGRVSAMAMVMGVLGWHWLALAVVSPFLVNYTVYVIQAPSAITKGVAKIWLYIFMVPLGFLSAITVSEKRILTIITTLAWLMCSVPQIYRYHYGVSQWLAWSIPAGAQIIALVLMMARWSVFEAAFERFGRLARVNQFVQVPTNEVEEQEEKEEGV